MRYFCVLCYLLCSGISFLHAQTTGQSYPILRSRGIPPSDFTSDILLKSEFQHRGAKEIDKGYRIRSNYFLNEILSSGRVLFGDTMTAFINSVADKLLKHDPALRKELRFYTLRSTEMNAMCLLQGVIFVTTGLLANLENEDELAFILGHEISHYVKQHSINTYKFSKKLKKTTVAKSNNSLESAIKSFYRYSRDNETMADTAGFNMFRGSGYNLQAAYTSLQKLQLGWENFHTTDWTPFSFEQDSLRAPEEPEKLKNKRHFTHFDHYSKSSVSDEEDKLSTHPSLESRKLMLKGLIGMDTLPNTGSDRFNHIKSLALQDMAYLYYLSGEYSKTILVLNYMERRESEDAWRQGLKYMSLFRYVRDDKAVLNGSMDELRNKNIESKSDDENLILHYLNNLSMDSNLHVLAAQQNILYKQTNNKNFLQYAEYYNEITDAVSFSGPGLKNPTRSDHNELKVVKDRKKRYLAYNQKIKSVDSVLFFIPNVSVVSMLRKVKRKYLDEEYAQNTLYSAYDLGVRELQINSYILDNRIGAEFNSTSYNRYCAVREWMTERSTWDTSVPMQMFSAANIHEDPFLDNMRYINSSAYIYFINRRNAAELEICTAIYFPIFPLFLLAKAVPVKNVYALQTLVDLHTGQVQYVSYEYYRHKFSSDVIKVQVFRTLYQFKYGFRK